MRLGHGGGGTRGGGTHVPRGDVLAPRRHQLLREGWRRHREGDAGGGGDLGAAEVVALAEERVKVSDRRSLRLPCTFRSVGLASAPRWPQQPAPLHAHHTGPTFDAIVVPDEDSSTTGVGAQAQHLHLRTRGQPPQYWAAFAKHLVLAHDNGTDGLKHRTHRDELRPAAIAIEIPLLV